MTNTLRKFMDGTRTLESRLTTAFEQAAHTMAGDGETTPLELVDQACDEIAKHVQPSGRGRYSFPFNMVTITFASPVPERQAHIEGICFGPPTIQQRVIARLASAGCDSLDLDVDVAFTDTPAPSWGERHYNVALARLKPAARPPRGPAVDVSVEVLQGSASSATYAFTAMPITIGRGTEVRDSRQQLLRINHVAFVENGDAVNQSVSRRHAHIDLDARTSRPRVIDDNSAQGTSIIRAGRGIAVPRGSRGLGLQSGDEIVLGQARVKVTFSE